MFSVIYTAVFLGSLVSQYVGAPDGRDGFQPSSGMIIVGDQYIDQGNQVVRGYSHSLTFATPSSTGTFTTAHSPFPVLAQCGGRGNSHVSRPLQDM